MRQLADAQVDRLGPARHDVCISCFGVMFFAGPVAAFTSIGRALRPGARMALLAWQAPERNQWYSETGQAIGGGSARGGSWLVNTRSVMATTVAVDVDVAMGTSRIGLRPGRLGQPGLQLTSPPPFSVSCRCRPFFAGRRRSRL